jgi:hypothetical protein
LYLHTGSVKTLPDAVRVMAKLQPNNTLPEDQVSNIVAFLEISAATASIGSRRRPVTITFAPSSANRRAVAAPIPVPPPLINVTLLANRII